MKTSNFILCTLIIGAILLGGFESSAQVINSNGKTYRVIAYSKSNTSVTSTSNHTSIEPMMNVYIPSSFTPNGDGVNDTFGIKGEGKFSFRLLIFNRWGEKIFESNNPNNQWDGTYHNQPAQQGEYIYQLMADGKEYKGQTGTVTLLR